MDKTVILDILNDWNYWKRPFPATHPRPLYGEKIARWMRSDEVVVIKGVRRSGKSTLMINRIKDLISGGIDVKNILFVNFEDPRFINHLDVALMDKILDTYLEYLAPDAMPHLFLDEVQNIPQWEKWVNKVYELKQAHIVLSGSNSSLLGREIASALSGRYLSVEVYPLSFAEYLSFGGMALAGRLDFVDQKIEIRRAFERYLTYGGFPRTRDYDTPQIQELLTTYKDSILLKDIVARYQLKDFGTLEEIASFLLSNTGIIQSINKLKNTFHISADMARNYVAYLRNAYMIFEVRKFDYSLKKQKANDKKYYSIDLGLSNIFRVPNLQHRGSDLETAVYLELRRRGYGVYYYKTAGGLECDFVVEQKGEITSLIQVTRSLTNEATRSRELKPFAKAIRELQLRNVTCLVLTAEGTGEWEYDGVRIQAVNILEWLLGV